ncbi:hypothetical protein SAMN04487891_109166 [Flagellimonas taeanensis]|uniref:Chaperone of endosialidase n=1 Tax=Flagellimonas taeanensis TaxID=1005926 RepID=A0A1M7ATL4_9FLAO|nr:hypothetical protein [Allomuricauda taeanensis]SFC35990.1 hypothetical protein SAMN04487891_109166 [Allomuricauda taeanensis]SHL46118.1 hypothetical protein SAMN05216293_3539 [Allomuricauda taeanensis]
MKSLTTALLFGLTATLVAQTNSFPDNGTVGIGTTSPNYQIDVINSYDPTENFLRFRVQDAPDDYMAIINATGSGGQFIPRIYGYHVSDNRYSIQFSGSTSETNDSGTNALVNFDARLSSGPVQNRPLFVWTSFNDKKMTMLANGNLGIGTTSPDAKLAVNGNIHAKEVKVDLVGWPDYVLKKGYNLPTLEEVEMHIKEKGHLINIPSAKEVEANGVELGEMNKLLLEKIEELTLYTIQQQRDLDDQKKKNETLEQRIQVLEKTITSFINHQ